MSNTPLTSAAGVTPRLYPNQPPNHRFSAAPYRQIPQHNYPNIAPAQQAAQGIPFYAGRGYLPRPGSDPYGGNAAYVMHIIRPTHMQQQRNLHGTVGADLVKGIPISSHPKVSASPSSVSDLNGYKGLRDITRDDSFARIRDRKVRIIDGASLYAQCRSWLRNGVHEESQPQYLNGVKSLPRPLPIPVGYIHSPKEEDGDMEEENEGDVEQLSSKELLRRHIKCAKKVQARLREERLQRIARTFTLITKIMFHQTFVPSLLNSKLTESLVNICRADSTNRWEFFYKSFSSRNCEVVEIEPSDSY